VDVYPWTAGSTQLVQILPPEFLEGSLDKATERLKNADERKRCAEILKTPQTRFENQVDLIGWENIMVTSVQTEKNRMFIGKRISEIAEMRGCDPAEAAFDMLAEYVRDKKMLTLAKAINKITQKPAEILSIPNKGLIKEGYDADIAIFDLAKIENHATYLDPKQFGTGFSYVLVNGIIANDHDTFLNVGSGKVIRRS
jgi:N-acyl-D-aspartate/D-glutamate deacylase